MDETIKARLMIRLLADDLVIAESEDAILWQKVLAAITGGSSRIDVHPGKAEEQEDRRDGPDYGEAKDAVKIFADELGVDEAALRGALAPSSEAPYLHIDSRYWEAMKKNTPPGGRGAMPPMRLAATALVLWFRVAKLGTATQGQAKALMKTAHLSDAHPERSLSGTEWLQTRGESIILNPAAISQAEEVVRAFCEKRKPSFKK